MGEIGGQNLIAMCFQHGVRSGRVDSRSRHRVRPRRVPGPTEIQIFPARSWPEKPDRGQEFERAALSFRSGFMGSRSPAQLVPDQAEYFLTWSRLESY
jgi:hypothetical protein